MLKIINVHIFTENGKILYSKIVAYKILLKMRLRKFEADVAAKKYLLLQTIVFQWRMHL